MSHEFLIRKFAEKAKFNSGKAIDSVPQPPEDGLEFDVPTAIAEFQLPHQLISEGLELVLKSLWLVRGNLPPPIHCLRRLFDGLEAPEKELVERVVKGAIKESSTGALPFSLPNVGAVMLMEDVKLGEGRSPGIFDAMSGYAEMDAALFFDAIDREWKSERTQYLGSNLQFETRGALRVNTRVLAGATLVCIELANWIIAKLQARGG